MDVSSELQGYITALPQSGSCLQKLRLIVLEVDNSMRCRQLTIPQLFALQSERCNRCTAMNKFGRYRYQCTVFLPRTLALHHLPAFLNLHRRRIFSNYTGLYHVTYSLNSSYPPQYPKNIFPYVIPSITVRPF